MSNNKLYRISCSMICFSFCVVLCASQLADTVTGCHVPPRGALVLHPLTNEPVPPACGGTSVPRGSAATIGRCSQCCQPPFPKPR
ncbi:unnamed protein product [Ixodes pacificus]